MNQEIYDYIKLLSSDIKIQELLIETIGKILLKQDNMDLFINNNEDKIIHIRDWISSIVENNEQWKTPRVLTIDALNNAADKYFEKKNNKIKTIELDERHEKLIANLGDYYIVQMLTSKALDNESKVMQHCIGHGYYDDKINDKSYKYLSLRDKYNKAHITLEIKNNEVKQLQGKQNQLPDFKYLEKMIFWLVENKYLIRIERYGLILNANDNKIYSVFDMPENCKVENGLNLICSKIKKLPDNLVVNDFLSLSNCYEIEELPKKLTVNGKLYLNYSKIKKIPEDIKINEDLFLNNSDVEELPNDFFVNGDLDLSYSKIKQLPNNLFVNGNLNLFETNIRMLPEDIKVKYGINLMYSSVKKLPDNLTCDHIKINREQIELIKKKMNIRVIMVDGKGYGKEYFFEKHKSFFIKTIISKIKNKI